MQLTDIERPIFDAVPHIFKRPLLYVTPSDPLLQVATFLAIGPQIYVDGVVVLDDRRAVGSIGAKHIIEYFVYHPKDWLQGTASMVMNRFENTVQADYPLTVALDIFSKTGFAFVPVTIRQSVVTSLSIRDVLRVVVTSRLETPIEELSTPVVAIEDKTSIGDAIEMMLEQNIRNLIVKGSNGNISVLNDRNILEYLLSYDSREKILSRGLDGLFETRIDILALTAPKSVKHDLPSGIAAYLLLDLNTQCLILRNGSIVTPWDLVMKGLRESRS